MSQAENVLVLGASARAAAFSALRAGLQPWCVDLFGDADLVVRCPTMRLRGRYPNGFLDMMGLGPAGPWLYTGGLENHPALVGELATRRPLWGNGPSVLTVARAPEILTQAARTAGLPAPEVLRDQLRPPREGRWVRKPLQGAGGKGITFCTEEILPPLPYLLVMTRERFEHRSPKNDLAVPDTYLQEYIAGDAAAALYVSLGRETHLLGLTRQLVGEPWLGAAPFHYCGSIGPLKMAGDLRRNMQRLGEALTQCAGLHGLFGVDGILAGGTFWPVEVNPRYTASVEVLELSLGLRALSWHRRAFVKEGPLPSLPTQATGLVGKAILFARNKLVFPEDGPWRAGLRGPPPGDDLWGFADLPHPGDVIEPGRPVLTLFACGPSVEACAAALAERTREVERCLYSGAGIG